MPFEIISAVLGNVVASAVSKLAPARKKTEFSDMPPEVFRQRNRLLYWGIVMAAAAGFFAPYFFFDHARNGRGGWFAGSVFGMPFSAIAAFVAVVWCIAGKKRALELIYYFEVEEKINLLVWYFLGVPLAIAGLTSFVLLLR